MADKLDEAKAFLANYPAEVQDVALALRGLILSVIPGAVEMVDPPGKCIGYGVGTGYKDLICTIILSKAGIKLGMVGGADLPDPQHLLEGAGKKHKYVVMSSAEDVKKAGVVQLLKAGAAKKQR